MSEADGAIEQSVTGDDEADGEVDDKVLTIQQASSLLKVPAPTIRSWERRYGVPVVGRSSGGHRRYSGAEIADLRKMRDLIEGGRRTGEAAALVKASQPTSPGPLVEAFLEAARALDPGSIGRTLDTARESIGLDRAVDEVLLPALREIGDWWHTGRMDVAHEHLASNATLAWLATIRPTGPVRPQPPIILSCGPRDHHTLGLEAIGALLRERRWDCRMLGARTPPESLARAAAETDAIAVVLVCHVSAGRPAAIEAFRSLRQRHLFYAGGAFATPRARHGVPGHYLGDHIARAADMIAATISEQLP